METVKFLIVQDFLKGYQVESDLVDGDFCFILFEFIMNYTTESLRAAYHNQKKLNDNKVNSETLRKLGYSEEDIQKAKL